MNHDILKRVIFDQHEVIKNAVIVERDIELEKNANYVLVGLRRAGKSTMLYKRVRDLINDGVKWEQIVYINFDDERLIGFSVSDFDDILLTAEEMSSEKHYFYFDEIQNIDNWENFAIRVANQGLKVDITGSNAKMISKEIEQRLGGRYISKEILPYSFEEYLRACGIEKAAYSIKDIGKVNALMEQFFIYGGFPASLDFKNKREYTASIYQKVLFGDIIAHNKIRNENSIRLMIKKIAETVGRDLSFTKLQNLITGIGYKVSKPVIIDYCGYCQDAFLLFSLENYYASFVDKTSNPKYYFRDNGVLNLFLDDKRPLLLENLVAISLYRKYQYDLYYLKGNKVDIDFYVSEKKIAIQAAYILKEDEVFERETSNLLVFARSIKEKCRLMIVTFEEEDIIEKDGYKIEVIPLKKFLLG